MKKRRSDRTRRHVQYHHVAIAALVVCFAIVITSVSIIALVQRNVTSYVHFVSPARFDSTGSKIFRPGDGRQYVIVDVEILNPTAHVFPLAPVVQTYVDDENGRHYPMAPTELTNPLVASDMEVDESRRGQLSYNVPVSARHLYFNFESGSSDTVTHRIQIK